MSARVSRVSNEQLAQKLKQEFRKQEYLADQRSNARVLVGGARRVYDNYRAKAREMFVFRFTLSGQELVAVQGYWKNSAEKNFESMSVFRKESGTHLGTLAGVVGESSRWRAKF